MTHHKTFTEEATLGNGWIGWQAYCVQCGTVGLIHQDHADAIEDAARHAAESSQTAPEKGVAVDNA